MTENIASGILVVCDLDRRYLYLRGSKFDTVSTGLKQTHVFRTGDNSPALRLRMMMVAGNTDMRKK